MPTEFTHASAVAAPARRAAWPRGLALFTLLPCACFLFGCESERAPGKGESGAAAKTAAPSRPNRDDPTGSPGSKPRAPLATPSVPPQLVACGELDFYRIGQSSLQIFEIAPELPPPQIRGSRIARQSTQIEIAEPLNVLSLAKKQTLVIAKGGVFHYELGQTAARRYAPIATQAPLFAWSEPGSDASFWVRPLDGEALHHYSLSSLSPVEPEPASRAAGSEAGDGKRNQPASEAKPGKPANEAKPSTPTNADRLQALPGFDSRLFAQLSDGTPLYSTQEGLVRPGGKSPPAPLPTLSTLAALLFADASPGRYWAADASGELGLWNHEKGGAPVKTTRVPGVVIDAAQQGDRVAVLSLAIDGKSYQPTVTIFEDGQQRGQLKVAPSVASGAQPKLDLCLIAGRPWVVVGDRHWLQLLDWSTPRLLAEW